MGIADYEYICVATSAQKECEAEGWEYSSHIECPIWWSNERGWESQIWMKRKVGMSIPVSGAKPQSSVERKYRPSNALHARS
jgi:hypothetical protein